LGRSKENTVSKQKDKTPGKKAKGASKVPSYVTKNAAQSDDKVTGQGASGIGLPTQGASKGKHKK